MIYASLRTIRQWHQPLTAPIYIALGLASGAVLLNLLLRHLRGVRARGRRVLALACLLVAAAMKWAYWQRIDGEAREYTIGAATGLGHLGKVRLLEPPHTQPNFLMREMGYHDRAQARREAAPAGAGCWRSRVPIVATLLTLVPAAGGEVGGGAAGGRCRWPSACWSSAGCSSPRPSTCRCCTTAGMLLSPLSSLHQFADAPGEHVHRERLGDHLHARAPGSRWRWRRSRRSRS